MGMMKHWSIEQANRNGAKEAVKLLSEVQKPNWNPIELEEKYFRSQDLFHQTESHQPECDCNLCMEYFGLSHLLGCFSEDDHATAVIRANEKMDEIKLEIKQQMKKSNLEFNLGNEFMAYEKQMIKAARKLLFELKNFSSIAEAVKVWIEENIEISDKFLNVSSHSIRN